MNTDMSLSTGLISEIDHRKEIQGCHFERNPFASFQLLYSGQFTIFHPGDKPISESITRSVISHSEIHAVNQSVSQEGSPSSNFKIHK